MTLFWGVVLNFVVGVGSGLAVQPVQRWWVRRSNRSNIARLTQVRTEYKRALHYSLNSDLLIARLIVNGLLLTFNGFLGIMAGVMTIFYRSAIPSKVHFSHSDFVAISLLTATTIFVAVLMGTSFNESVRLYAHVVLFEDYVNQIPTEIRNEELEAEIIARRERRSKPEN